MPHAPHLAGLVQLNIYTPVIGGISLALVDLCLARLAQVIPLVTQAGQQGRPMRQILAVPLRILLGAVAQ